MPNKQIVVPGQKGSAASILTSFRKFLDHPVIKGRCLFESLLIGLSAYLQLQLPTFALASQ